jgi:NAD(P)-dependent dehydrogenase (short-subunit alcohol dehydrogenase family)
MRFFDSQIKKNWYWTIFLKFKYLQNATAYITMCNSTISWVVYFFPRQALSIAATVTEIEHRVPLKRAGLPHGVAGVVAFLCSPNAAYITGQTICVEGGMTIHGFTLDLSKLGM